MTYTEGYRNAQADKRLGIFSRYAYHGISFTNAEPGLADYSQGYRDAMNGLPNAEDSE